MGARRCRARSVGVALTVAALTLAQLPPAFAGWEEDVGTLRIGMVAPSGDRGIAGLSELTTAFEYATGVPTEILVARDYPALIRAAASGRVHYAIYSATAYAVAEALCDCIEPIVAPLGTDGALGLRAVLIGRRGSVDSLAALSGARVVAGPVGALGPQSLALAAVTNAGSSVLHASSFSEAERVFRSGDADVIVGWEPVGDDGSSLGGAGTPARLAADGLAREELVVLWSSETLHNGPHALRSDLPEPLKETLGRFLVDLRQRQPRIYHLLEPDRDGGFTRVDATAYAAAHRFVAGLATR